MRFSVRSNFQLWNHGGHEETDLSAEAQSAKVDLGKLSVFAGVREYPTRIKCASLAWHTLKAALERQQRATTEEKG